MAAVTININGRPYDIACDDGQEQRVQELATYVDQKAKLIARSGSAYNDTHLMVLAMLVMADELFEAKAQTGGGASSKMREEQERLLETINALAKRVEGLAARVRAA